MNTFLSIIKNNICLVLIILFAGIWQHPRAQETKHGFVGLRLTANFSTLHHDTMALKQVLLPGVALDYTYFFDGGKLATHGGVGFNMRGGSTTNATIKFRNQYIDLFATQRYYPNSSFFFEAGLQYAYLVKQRIRTLSDESGTGAVSRRGWDYASHPEGIVGVGFQLQSDISLNLRYAIPLQPNAHKNLQLSLHIKENAFNFKTRLTTFRNLNEALLQPAKCEKLVLHREKIRSIPPEISSLVNLKELFLDGNEIRQFPGEIAALSKL